MNANFKANHYHSHTFTDGREKLIRAITINSFSDKKSFLRKFREDFCWQLRAKNDMLVPYTSAEFVGEVLILTRKYVKGNSLEEILNQGIINPNTALVYVDSICKGINMLHNLGVSVMNLKPSNIIITTENKVTLVDFGISCIREDTIQDKDSFYSLIINGPEQITNPEVNDLMKQDIFMLGMIIYILAFGKLPWNSINIPKIMKQITSNNIPFPKNAKETLVSLIKSCFESNSTKRIDIRCVLDIITKIKLCEKGTSRRPISTTKLSRPIVKKPTRRSVVCFSLIPNRRQSDTLPKLTK